MILAYKLKNMLITGQITDLEDTLSDNKYNGAFTEICNNETLLESVLKNKGIKPIVESTTAFNMLLDSEIGRQSVFNSIEFLSYLSNNYNTNANSHPVLNARVIDFAEGIVKNSTANVKSVTKGILVSLSTNNNTQKFIVPDFYLKIGEYIPSVVRDIDINNKTYPYYPIFINSNIELINGTAYNSLFTLSILPI